MRQIADGVYQLEPRPDRLNTINQYVVGDVLIDAGLRSWADAIIGDLVGVQVSAHALTHAHHDHQGSSHEVCETLGIPLWCSALEADNMESGDLLSLVRDLPGYHDGVRSLLGPPHPVARRLSEGDEVGGFVVVETPGHTPGHISFWRETDGVLIAGDVLKSWDFVTGETGLSEPRDEFTLDPTSNRHSILKLAQLEPRLICVGHGAAVAGSTELRRLAAGFSELGD